MAVVVGTNSWITLAQAENYFSERIESSSWDALPDDATKEKYLITAYRWIFFDPSFSVPADSVADGVKFGQCEAALFLINHYKEYEKREAMISSGITKFNYSSWHEYLGETKKPSSVTAFFTKEGYYQGGFSFVQLEDPSTLT